MADTKTSKQPGLARSLAAMFQQEREDAVEDFRYYVATATGEIGLVLGS